VLLLTNYFGYLEMRLKYVSASECAISLELNILLQLATYILYILISYLPRVQLSMNPLFDKKDILCLETLKEQPYRYYGL
jgi:hypothetical protein